MNKDHGLYRYLYGIVYPSLAKHLNITIEELDSELKAGLGVGDKHDLTHEDLLEFVRMTKAYAKSVGCVINDFIKEDMNA